MRCSRVADRSFRERLPKQQREMLEHFLEGCAAGARGRSVCHAGSGLTLLSECRAEGHYSANYIIWHWMR